MPPYGTVPHEGLAFTPVTITTPGLYYVHRDGRTVSRLDAEVPPTIERPEADVLTALLRFALNLPNGGMP